MVRKAGLKYLDFVPGPIDAHFNFYIDAMVGTEYDNNELDQAYMSVIEKVADRRSNLECSSDLPDI